MRWLLIVAAVLLAGTAGTARAGETAYKSCGQPGGERAGYSLNAHTPCWLVDRANRVVSSRKIETGVVSFRISVLRLSEKARYQLTCDPWGGWDGLRFVTCRNRAYDFFMRFTRTRIGGNAAPAYPKACGHTFYRAFSMNARTSCTLVNSANNILARPGRLLHLPSLTFTIWPLNGRVRLQCNAWGGVDGLARIRCRNPEHGFDMRFQRGG